MRVCSDGRLIPEMRPELSGNSETAAVADYEEVWTPPLFG